MIKDEGNEVNDDDDSVSERENNQSVIEERSEEIVMSPGTIYSESSEQNTEVDPMNYNSKFNYKFKTIHKLDSFGTNFVVKGTDDHKYKAKCLAYCPKETHLIILNMKNYKRIQDRI